MVCMLGLFVSCDDGVSSFAPSPAPRPEYRGWKRMFFVVRGSRLTYSRGADRNAGGGVIQLAGCRIAVSESSDSASNVLSVEHGERGTRRLKCPSADSCREWLYVLREAAAVTEHSLSPPENSSSEDLFDTRRRLTATLDGLRAHGYNDADVNRFVDKTALHESETLPRALAERDEAKLESAMLREHLLILSQDQKSAAEARVETLMQKNVHGRSSAAEEAIAALEQERKEVLRLGEERQVQLQVSTFAGLFTMSLVACNRTCCTSFFAGPSSSSEQIRTGDPRFGG